MERGGGGVGDGLVDFGTPLADGVRVSKDGTAPSTREVAGYSILEAQDMDAAVELARSHPHLQMPGGCGIEVHEEGVSDVPPRAGPLGLPCVLPAMALAGCEHRWNPPVRCDVAQA